MGKVVSLQDYRIRNNLGLPQDIEFPASEIIEYSQFVEDERKKLQERYEKRKDQYLVNKSKLEPLLKRTGMARSIFPYICEAPSKIQKFVKETHMFKLELENEEFILKKMNENLRYDPELKSGGNY